MLLSTKVCRLGVLITLLLAGLPVVEAGSEDLEPIQIMVIGVTHFDDPGLDLVDTSTVDILTADRQKQLADLAASLAEFQPTLVAIEQQTLPPHYLSDGYQTFTVDDLKMQRNENVQLGYRLANLVGLNAVHGIDEQSSEDEPEYFPFDRVAAHAEKTSRLPQLLKLLESLQVQVKEAVSQNASVSIAGALLAINRDGSFLSSTDYFFDFMKYDQGESQPGAELYAYYMMRNAKIFGKLMSISKPGDRVIVIYGAGHKQWLEHLIDNAPGFVLASPVPYLEEAVSASQ